MWFMPLARRDYLVRSAYTIDIASSSLFYVICEITYFIWEVKQYSSEQNNLFSVRVTANLLELKTYCYDFHWCYLEAKTHIFCGATFTTCQQKFLFSSEGSNMWNKITRNCWNGITPAVKISRNSLLSFNPNMKYENRIKHSTRKPLLLPYPPDVMETALITVLNPSPPPRVLSGVVGVKKTPQNRSFGAFIYCYLQFKTSKNKITPHLIIVR